MGAHRLYSHRAFKCKDWLKAILIIGQTLAGEFSQFTWTRDHRQHHKYSDTDGDPHNACRGFFFSHVGWLLVYKHPEAIEKGRKIDMSDLINDPYVMFQKKYYIIIFTIFSVLIPTFVPFYLWGETLWNGFFTCVVFRLAYVINVTSLVNSLAHYYGNKPYSCDIIPVENALVSLLSMGEGWHNYHHTFPWDYRAAELGIYLNLTTKFIDFCTYMGWVWDRKYATPEMIKSRAIKRGDDTHFKYGNRRNNDTSVPENVAYDCNIET